MADVALLVAVVTFVGPGLAWGGKAACAEALLLLEVNTFVVFKVLAIILVGNVGNRAGSGGSLDKSSGLLTPTVSELGTD